MILKDFIEKTDMHTSNQISMLELFFKQQKGLKGWKHQVFRTVTGVTTAAFMFFLAYLYIQHLGYSGLAESFYLFAGGLGLILLLYPSRLFDIRIEAAILFFFPVVLDFILSWFSSSNVQALPKNYFLNPYIIKAVLAGLFVLGGALIFHVFTPDRKKISLFALATFTAIVLLPAGICYSLLLAAVFYTINSRPLFYAAGVSLFLSCLILLERLLA